MKSNYLFEVSWEVCNKVGGIHTVVSTKAKSINERYGNNHILIGPDIYKDVNNPEFIPDETLFSAWKTIVQKSGLKIKIGRWNIKTNPIVVLVDFSELFVRKDEILKELWDRYKLDSLTGGWDYIEPVMFGYAAGMLIESYLTYYDLESQNNVAQFHEWMTGSGLLYLKKNMPSVACAFTTHASVLGRCVAGNGLPLYDKLSDYNPAELASRFNVKSKHSLEQCSATNADVFTTVSDITAKECSYFLSKEVDIVTPNGFSDCFVPESDKYSEIRSSARSKLLKVVEAVTGSKISSNAMVVGLGGRYEFINKGIDVAIEALAQINNSKNKDREIVAFFMVPAGFSGVNQAVKHNLDFPYKTAEITQSFVTHTLTDEYNDPIINALKRSGLNNTSKCNVKVVFCPSYLNGNDGVFDMTYWDLVVGMDLTLFPSYYEPWGYTPLESLALRVPTITTTLAGFGLWVNDNYIESHPSIVVIDRNDTNKDYVVSKIAASIIDLSKLSAQKAEEISQNAYDVSRIATWDNLSEYYYNAYEMALEKVKINYRFSHKTPIDEVSYNEKQLEYNIPNWVSVVIHKALPEVLEPLEKLAKNLWWCWNYEAVDLFDMADHKVWEECEHNPIELLDRLSLNDYKVLAGNVAFIEKLNKVYAQFEAYMSEKNSGEGPTISYFSMEYGLHPSLKIYSGGLGVLAGDYLKEASDKNTKITAVGLLYRYGYFKQRISTSGNQVSENEAQSFSKLPVQPVLSANGKWKTISLCLPNRTLKARIWRVDVGRVELYLLDTDFDYNRDDDRTITYHLYGGNWENRLKQEILLGIGGIKALRKVGINTELYHCNEGHAAFIGLERVREFVFDDNLTFSQAVELVRSSSLFTTHTPVPAGHDSFSESLLYEYMSSVPEELNITWERFMSLGRISKYDPNAKFSMSFLAANLSQFVNGVSMLHGDVSKKIFNPMWPGYTPQELDVVDYVTNGVHYPTWTAREWKDIHKEVFGSEFQTHHYDKSCFDGIYKISDERIWATRNLLRTKLIEEVKRRIMQDITGAYFTPRQVVTICDKLRSDVLTIGFARRFATYKRAHLLFRNLDRLDAIVNNPERPVQFLFAGKAHPADQAGQDLIKHIIEVSKMPKFIGKILFVPNYDMTLARFLVSGVDVWLNTPTRPEEASGTSGEKAAMNGVMHFSVLDGWWVEGYRNDSGWALPQKQTFDNHDYQNELDSEMIYNIIEDEIAPTYYNKNKKGLSKDWVAYIKNTIAKVASNFTTNRMLNDYEDKYYYPLSKRFELLKANDNAKAIELARWKQFVVKNWDSVELSSIHIDKTKDLLVQIGNDYSGEVILNIGDFNIEDISLELVFADSNAETQFRIKKVFEFDKVGQEGSLATYRIHFTPEESGLTRVALRAYPYHSLLITRQDIGLVKWLNK